MLLLDGNVWFSLEPSAWVLPVVVGAGLVIGTLAGVLFTVSCLWAAATRGGTRRERLQSLAWGVGAGALVAWGVGDFGHQLVEPLFALDDDFAAVRLSGTELRLVPGLGDEVARPVADLRGVELSCDAERISGEEDWRCRRSVRLTWADGAASRGGDTLQGGWHACPDALTIPRADAQSLLAAAGRPDALILHDECTAR